MKYARGWTALPQIIRSQSSCLSPRTAGACWTGKYDLRSIGLEGERGQSVNDLNISPQ
jgi:hypothetical protein